MAAAADAAAATLTVFVKGAITTATTKPPPGRIAIGDVARVVSQDCGVPVAALPAARVVVHHHARVEADIGGAAVAALAAGVELPLDGGWRLRLDHAAPGAGGATTLQFTVVATPSGDAEKLTVPVAALAPTIAAAMKVDAAAVTAARAPRVFARLDIAVLHAAVPKHSVWAALAAAVAKRSRLIRDTFQVQLEALTGAPAAPASTPAATPAATVAGTAAPAAAAAVPAPAPAPAPSHAAAAPLPTYGEAPPAFTEPPAPPGADSIVESRVQGGFMLYLRDIDPVHLAHPRLTAVAAALAQSFGKVAIDKVSLPCRARAAVNAGGAPPPPAARHAQIRVSPLLATLSLPFESREGAAAMLRHVGTVDLFPDCRSASGEPVRQSLTSSLRATARPPQRTLTVLVLAPRMQAISRLTTDGSTRLMLVSAAAGTPLRHDRAALDKLCYSTWKVNPVAIVDSSAGLGEVELRIDDFAVAAAVAEVPQVVWEPAAGGPATPAMLQLAVLPVYAVNLMAFFDAESITHSVDMALRRELGPITGSYVTHVEMLRTEAASAVFMRSEAYRAKLLALGCVPVRDNGA